MFAVLQPKQVLEITKWMCIVCSEHHPTLGQLPACLPLQEDEELESEMGVSLQDATPKHPLQQALQTSRSMTQRCPMLLSISTHCTNTRGPRVAQHQQVNLEQMHDARGNNTKSIKSSSVCHQEGLNMHGMHFSPAISMQLENIEDTGG